MTPLSLVPEQARLSRHVLWRAGRAADRGGAAMERSHERRGPRIAAWRAAKPRQGSVPKRIVAKRLPMDQARANQHRARSSSSPSRSAIGRGRPCRARHPGASRDRRSAKRVGRAGFAVRRLSDRRASTACGARWSTRSSPTNCTALRRGRRSDGAPQALVDLAAIRDRLLQYGWVQDARVSRRLPDTLVIDIVERTPAAMWQNDGSLR